MNAAANAAHVITLSEQDGWRLKPRLNGLACYARSATKPAQAGFKELPPTECGAGASVWEIRAGQAREPRGSKRAAAAAQRADFVAAGH